MTAYPTAALLASYKTTGPRDSAAAVVAVIVACILLFMLQDWLAHSHSIGVARALGAFTSEIVFCLSLNFYSDTASRLLDDVFPRNMRARVIESMARRPPSTAGNSQVSHARLSQAQHRSSVAAVTIDDGACPPRSSTGSVRDASAPWPLPPPLLFPIQPLISTLSGSGALMAIQKFVGLEAKLAEPARVRAASSLGRAVADRFPSVSIIFSDVVGFTAWSSSVAPEQVFAYLCALFGAFDKLGARHGAYKMETVGDSYMAVCGLPDPDCQHAERAADFALALLAASAEVGRATGVRLGLRVGVHTGPVLGGVLLGERARFQLFGDAVNLASRMEARGSFATTPRLAGLLLTRHIPSLPQSTGEPGRVQLSPAFVELLFTTAFGSFDIAPRGTVAVKGKGSLETSWLVGRVPGTRPLPAPPRKSVGGSRRRNSLHLSRAAAPAGQVAAGGDGGGGGGGGAAGSVWSFARRRSLTALNSIGGSGHGGTASAASEEADATPSMGAPALRSFGSEGDAAATYEGRQSGGLKPLCRSQSDDALAAVHWATPLQQAQARPPVAADVEL